MGVMDAMHALSMANGKGDLKDKLGSMGVRGMGGEGGRGFARERCVVVTHTKLEDPLLITILF